MRTVSVIIPCYNAALFLKEAIDSVMAQTLLPIEIICVDDGSADETLAVLNSLKENNPLLQVVSQKNKGATAARNVGLSIAEGDYIQFLDADDTLLPSKLEHQLLVAAKHDYPELIIGAYVKLDASGKQIHIQEQLDDGVSVWLKLMRTQLGITSSNLFARQSVIAAGIWNELLKSSQEYDLMFRMMKMNARVALCPIIDTEIRQRNSSSITSSNKGENWKRYIALRLHMREHIVKHVGQEDRSAVDQAVFDSIRQLYPHDRKEALRLFEQEMPSDYQPLISGTTSDSYIRMYRILGFSMTERLRGLMRPS